MAFSNDSDEEYSGGGTTASSTKLLFSSTIPKDHATGVSPFTSVVIGFNKDVNSSSVSGNNFSLSSNGIAVPAKLSNSKNVVVLLPSFFISNATLYSASVFSTVQDISGNSLDQDSSWNFTTVSVSSDNSSGDTGSGGDTVADTTQPSVVSISPSENASSITVDSAIIVVFSESICGEQMRIISFIIDPLEVAKILEHIVEQTLREPPLMLTDPVPFFSDLGDTNFQYPEVPWYPAILLRSTIELCKGICVLSGPFCRFSEESKAM